jgi:hypothetical protein
MKKIISVFAVALVFAGQLALASAEDKKPQKARPPKDLYDIKDEARRGGYKDQLDRAIKEYGGTRLKEEWQRRQPKPEGPANVGTVRG